MKYSTRMQMVKEIFSNAWRYVLDVDVQRGEVWTIEKMIRFIETIIKGLPIQHLLVNVKDGKYIVYDGKQRTTAILKFLKGEFKFNEQTPDIVVEDSDGIWHTYEIKNKGYNELPEVLRERINSYELEFKAMENATAEECRNMFILYNNGTPTTNYDISRAKNYGPVMEVIKDISKEKFYSDLVRLSSNERMKSVDQQLIMQTMMMVQGENEGFGHKVMEEYMKKLSTLENLDEVISCIEDASEYLYRAFNRRCITLIKPETVKKPRKLTEKMYKGMTPEEKAKADEEYKQAYQKYEEYNAAMEIYNTEKEKADPRANLKRSNIPMICLCATIAKDKMTPEEFFEWHFEFFSKKGSNGYSGACTSGTASKDKVNSRRNIMVQDLVDMLVAEKGLSAIECNETLKKYKQ